jgi:hypothetical protein
MGGQLVSQLTCACPDPHHTIVILAIKPTETVVTIPLARADAARHFRRFLDIGDAVGPKPKARR